MGYGVLLAVVAERGQVFAVGEQGRGGFRSRVGSDDVRGWPALPGRSCYAGHLLVTIQLGLVVVDRLPLAARDGCLQLAFIIVQVIRERPLAVRDRMRCIPVRLVPEGHRSLLFLAQVLTGCSAAGVSSPQENA